MKDEYIKKFNRTYVSMNDFMEAETYLQEFEPEWNGNLKLNDTIKRSLISSAIIAYARPFSGNDEHKEAIGKLHFEPKEVLLNDQIFIELHDKIINLRKKVVAHSDFKSKPAHRERKLDNGFQVRAKNVDVLEENIDVRYFRGLCIQMHKYCAQKLHELNDNF